MASKTQPTKEQAQPIRKHSVKVTLAWRDLDAIEGASELIASADHNVGISTVAAHSLRNLKIDAERFNALLKAVNRQCDIKAQHVSILRALARYSALAAKETQQQLTPLTQFPRSTALTERLQAAVASGELEWGGGQFRPDPPSVTLPEGETLADVLAEARHR